LAAHRALLRDAERAGDGRPAAVGAENPFGADPPPVREDDAPGWILIRAGAHDSDDLGFGLERRSGGLGRLDASLVEHDAARADGVVEAVDGGEATARLVAETADDASVGRHLVLG